jgi:hypothetical protein
VSIHVGDPGPCCLECGGSPHMGPCERRACDDAVHGSRGEWACATHGTSEVDGGCPLPLWDRNEPLANEEIAQLRAIVADYGDRQLTAAEILAARVVATLDEMEGARVINEAAITNLRFQRDGAVKRVNELVQECLSKTDVMEARGCALAVALKALDAIASPESQDPDGMRDTWSDIAARQKTQAQAAIDDVKARLKNEWPANTVQGR